jgi:hypothetical protein
MAFEGIVEFASSGVLLVWFKAAAMVSAVFTTADVLVEAMWALFAPWWLFTPKVWASLTGLVVGGAVLLKLARNARIAREEAVRRNLTILPAPTGFFAGPLGKIYYRPTLGDGVYQTIPAEVAVPPNGDLLNPACQASVTYKFVELAAGDPDESVVRGSVPPRPAIKTPAWMVLLGVERAGGQMSTMGMGFRAGEWLITARHILENPLKIGYKAVEIIVSREGRSACVDITSCEKVTIGGQRKSAHFTDIVAYRLRPEHWATAGVRSIKPADLLNTGEGLCEVYGCPSTDVLVACGALVRDPVKEKTAGVVTHTCSTTQCFSGSPLVMRRNARELVIGMHVAGGDGSSNFAIGHCALTYLLRKVGFLEKSVPGRVWNILDKDEALTYEQQKQQEIEEALLRAAEAAEEEMEEQSGSIHSSGYTPTENSEDVEAEYEAIKAFEGTDKESWNKEVGARMDRGNTGGSSGYEQERVPMPKGLPLSMRSVYVRPTFNSPAWADEVEDEGMDTKCVMILEFVRNACSLVDDPPMVVNGWVRRHCLVGSRVGRKSQNKPLARLHEMGLIDMKNFEQEQWLKPSDGTEDKVYECEEVEAKPKDDKDHSELDSMVALMEVIDRNLADFPPDSIPTVSDESRDAAIPSAQVPDRFKVFKTGGRKYWASHVDDAEELQESPNLDTTARLALKEWMTTYDPKALLALKDVGADAILRDKAMVEYLSYMAAGAVAFKHDPDAPMYMNSRDEVHAKTVGTCTMARATSSPIRCVSEEAMAVLKSIGAPPEAAKYCLPPTGPSAVRESLTGQFKRQAPGNWDQIRKQGDFTAKVEEFCDMYPTVNPCTSAQFVDFVDRFISNMDGSKSAGWSARYKPGPKQIWASGKNRDDLLYLVSARLALRMASASALPTMTPWDMVKLGLRDPEELGPKMEGHDEGKVKDKRWRMIWVTSMIDAVAQAYTHKPQNNEDISAYGEEILKCQGVGMGHHDEGIAMTGKILEWVADGGDRVSCSDASGWDLSVSRDGIVFDAERRISRFTEYSDTAAELLMAEAFCNSAHVIVVGKTLVVPMNFGITASGIPSTAAQNSVIRSFTLTATGATRAHTIGDDEAHAGKVDVALLATTGVITKGAIADCPVDGPIELTSHDYEKKDGVWTARFRNLAKMLAHLDLKRVPGEPPSDNSIKGMRHCLRHSPDEDKMLCDFVTQMGWTVFPAEDTDWE